MPETWFVAYTKFLNCLGEEGHEVEMIQAMKEYIDLVDDNERKGGAIQQARAILIERAKNLNAAQNVELSTALRTAIDLFCDFIVDAPFVPYQVQEALVHMLIRARKRLYI